MRKSFFGYIWAYSGRQQLVILAITCLAFPVVYMSLEVPKRIINSAIEGHTFPVEVLGVAFEQIPYLFLLSGIFLALVLLNNGIKFVLNYYKGVVGERMLRRLRYQLFEAILRFRPRAFRTISGDQLIPMVTSEVEDLGHTISEAIATPAFQGGSLAVYISFIFVQNVWLGLVAVSLYPLQAWLIPHLQRQVSFLARDRVRNLRVVADRVGGGVAGSETLHVDGTRAYHLAHFTDRLHDNYTIRLALYKKKYVIKFLNNFMNQMPPFIFYAAGGYLVIKGDLSIGSLVVSISAYQDISGPWKDLLGYYQRYATSAIKYQTIIENFEPEDRFPEERFAERAGPAAAAPTPGGAEGGAQGGPQGEAQGARLVLEQVAVEIGGGTLSEVAAELAPGGCLAVVGGEESGRTELLQAVVGLLPLRSGRILVDGASVQTMTEAEIGLRLAYAGQEPYLFEGSLRDNLAYPLSTHQRGPSRLPEAEARYRRQEAALTGNAEEDYQADWVDVARAGVADAAALQHRMIALLSALGMAEDLVLFGLHQHADPERDPDFVASLLRVRAAIDDEIARRPELARLVELWDPEAINDSGVLAGNLLFGFPKDPAVGIDGLLQDRDLVEVWRASGLIGPLTAIGAEAAGTFIRLFLDVSEPADLLGQDSPLTHEQLEALRPAVAAYEKGGGEGLAEEQGRALIGVALRLKPGRYRLQSLTAEVRDKILEARRSLRADWQRFAARYASFDRDSFIPSMDIEHNLLQGKIRLGRSQNRRQVVALICEAVEQEGLTERIRGYGLEHQVGVAGGALSGHQRRVVGLARALVKRPALLVADLGQGLDAEGIAVLRRLQAGSLVLGLSQLDRTLACDRVLVVGEGRVQASGTPAELAESDEAAALPARGDRYS